MNVRPPSPPPQSIMFLDQVLMRVKGKPDALDKAEVALAEHETPLKLDCKALAIKVEGEQDPTELAAEMEVIMTHYLRARSLEYDSVFGWTEILSPLMSVPMSRGDRYNCSSFRLSLLLFLSKLICYTLPLSWVVA